MCPLLLFTHTVHNSYFFMTFTSIKLNNMAGARRKRGLLWCYLAFQAFLIFSRVPCERGESQVCNFTRPKMYEPSRDWKLSVNCEFFGRFSWALFFSYYFLFSPSLGFLTLFGSTLRFGKVESQARAFAYVPSWLSTEDQLWKKVLNFTKIDVIRRPEANRSDVPGQIGIDGFFASFQPKLHLPSQTTLSLWIW